MAAWGIVTIVVGVIASILGYVIGAGVKQRSCVGALRMDHSDPNDPPYLFLELDPDGMQKICTHRIVSLRVRVEDYLPPSRK